jgi:hypothetical protein
MDIGGMLRKDEGGVGPTGAFATAQDLSQPRAIRKG